MRIKRPSPSLVVSIIAVVMASSGSAVAASKIAATSVDGYSAVGASSSLAGARGKLVATKSGGTGAGTLPGKFVSGVVQGDGVLSSVARAQDVIDNQTGAPLTLTTIPGLGTITSVCEDQSNTAGKEDPRQTIAFLNQSGAAISYARQIGNNNAPIISGPQNGTSTPFTIAGSNTFQLLIQSGTKSVTVQGIARQDGTNSAARAVLHDVPDDRQQLVDGRPGRAPDARPGFGRGPALTSSSCPSSSSSSSWPWAG